MRSATSVVVFGQYLCFLFLKKPGTPLDDAQLARYFFGPADCHAAFPLRMYENARRAPELPGNSDALETTFNAGRLHESSRRPGTMQGVFLILAGEPN